MNFQTWKCKGQQYVAVDNGDGWHVIREDGENYGAWRTPEAFRKLQRDNDPNGFLGLPGSVGRLSVRVGADTRQRIVDSDPPTGTREYAMSDLELEHGCDEIGDPGVHDKDPATLNAEESA